MTPKQRASIGAAASAKSRARRTEARDSSTHPATSEIEYSPDQLEFMAAIEAYKNRTGHKFPTWCEVLGILKGLGYEKRIGT